MKTQDKKNICIITTGGTIDKVYFDASSEFEVGSPVIEHILTEAKSKIHYRLLPLMRKDSLEIDDADRQKIRQAVEGCEEDLILITHGTDTMTDTAKYLQGLNKTVVLTGSLSPARFRSTDAIFNIGLALGALQSITPGVYITMNGQIFAADKVVKDKALKQFIAL